MTVKQLRELLANLPDNASVAIPVTPNHNAANWTHIGIEDVTVVPATADGRQGNCVHLVPSWKLETTGTDML